MNKGYLCSDEISGKNYDLKAVAKKASSSMRVLKILTSHSKD